MKQAPLSKPTAELLPPTTAHTAAPDQVRSAIHALKEIQRPVQEDAHDKEAECHVADKDAEVSQGAAVIKSGAENMHK